MTLAPSTPEVERTSGCRPIPWRAFRVNEEANVLAVSDSLRRSIERLQQDAPPRAAPSAGSRRHSRAALRPLPPGGEGDRRAAGGGGGRIAGDRLSASGRFQGR